MQIIFLSGTNVNKFLGRLKKFGPAQNILGPVKGQGIKEFQISQDLQLLKNCSIKSEPQF